MHFIDIQFISLILPLIVITFFSSGDIHSSTQPYKSAIYIGVSSGQFLTQDIVEKSSDTKSFKGGLQSLLHPLSTSQERQESSHLKHIFEPGE